MVTIPGVGPHRARATSKIERTSMAVSAAAWAAFALLICLDAVGIRPVGASLGIVTTWLMGIGALFLILPMTGGDPKIGAVLAHGLHLGDADLDDVLVTNSPRRWRAVPWVGTALACVATTAWTLCLIYSIQLGCGVYDLPGDASLGLLRLLMAAAVWPTVVRVSGHTESRQQAMYDVACDAHAALRGNVAVLGAVVKSLEDKRAALHSAGRVRQRGPVPVFRAGSAGNGDSGRVAPGA